MKVKILIATIVILAVLPSIFAGRKRGKGNRRRQGNGEDAGCGEWELAECVPKKGSCGKGKQLATRSGDSCRKTEKQMRCTVPCEGEDNCRYKKGPDSVWSECDGDNMMSMERVLKDPAQADCAPTKTFQRPCKQRKVKQGKKAGCKYARGEWSDCVEGKKTRVDTLKKESGEAECPAERTKERRCSAGNCKYEMSDWSGCSDGQRTRSKVFVSGDTDVCDKESKTTTRSCLTKNGKERCFFGAWSDFGECQNGVKTKTRPLLAGGERCQRQTAKTKPCRDKAALKRERKAIKKAKKDERRAKRQEKKEQKKSERQQGRQERRQNRRKNRRCQYTKGEWSTCDPLTNQKSRIYTLESGAGCEETRVKSRQCHPMSV